MNLTRLNQSGLYIALLSLLVWGCSPSTEETKRTYQTIGSIEVLDERLQAIVDPGADIEILASGFSWSEGPVWVPALNSLLFSDVPMNKVYQWNEADSITVYLEPSGNTGFAPASTGEGANGLMLDNEGNLTLCQHGDRRVAKWTTSEAGGSFETLVQTFEGKRFNSPNDLAIASDGSLFFTDPPYGLARQDADSLKEISFNGVYVVKDSTLTLIDSTLTRPNGVALSPDEQTLIVANSDEKMAIWRTYDLRQSPLVGNLLFDATSMVGQRPGLADGLKVNKNGIIFATGPGGVLILTLKGEHLGTILTTKHTANCALSPDEKTLYITADDLLLRVALK